ncbi:MAG: TonB-dependent receptor [Blastocatellales bacterium]
MNKIAIMLVIALSLLVSASPAAAQNIKAALSGRVTDANGAIIADAEVSITDQLRGGKRQVITNSQGGFQQPGLEPGRYVVEVSRDGFARYQSREIELKVGDHPQLEIRLQPGQVIADVQVVAESPSLVRLDEVKLSRSFTSEEMNDLPVQAGGAGRNFYAQARTAPGVALSTVAHAPFAVGGQRPFNNNYLIDSMDSNDANTGRIAGRGVTEQLISQEAVASFEILTHNFKAEYGRNSGGVVSLVSKSGTNEFHGSLYEYHNDSALSARNFFEAAKPSRRSNLAGFTLGGPVKKDRIFFFGQYEIFRLRGDAPARYQGLTDEERARAVAAVRPLVDLYPRAPQPNARLFTISQPNNTDQYTLLARGDIVLTNKQNLMARFNKTRSDRESYGAGNIVTSFTPGERVTLSGAVQHNYAITPRLLNEARAGYSRQVENDLDEHILPLFLGDPKINGEVGLLRVTGLSSPGIPSYLNQYNFQNNYQFIDDLTWTRGAHQFKFGMSLRRVQVNGGNIDNTFRGQLTFLSVNDFLAGRPASYTRNAGNPRIGLRRTEWQSYAQDDWKITPYLTLNLGLRYELNTAPREALDRIPAQYLLDTDRNNFAPRFGFAWQPFRDSKTVVRGGYGVYFNVLEMSFLGLTRFNPPLIESFTAVNPTFPNLLEKAQRNIPSGLMIPDPNTRTPYAQHINLAVERELWTPRSSLSVAYVSTLGRSLSRARRPNGGENIAQSLRPDPSVGVVTRLETSSLSNYHSLQLSWSQRFSNDLQVRAAYTWSRFIDDVSAIPTSNAGLDRTAIPLDERNLRLDRGVSDFDIPHILTMSYIWRLPFFRQNRWLGGWSVAGISTLQSGRSFTLFSGTNNLEGTNNNRVNDVAGTLTRDTSSAQAISLANGVTRAQITPSAGALGALGRNTERGDGLVDWSFSLSKDFGLTERVRMQLRAELFNAFNATNFNAVDGVLVSPNFGRYTSAFDPRRAQLAARVVF